MCHLISSTIYILLTINFLWLPYTEEFCALSCVNRSPIEDHKMCPYKRAPRNGCPLLCFCPLIRVFPSLSILNTISFFYHDALWNNHFSDKYLYRSPNCSIYFSLKASSKCFLNVAFRKFDSSDTSLGSSLLWNCLPLQRLSWTVPKCGSLWI